MPMGYGNDGMSMQAEKDFEMKPISPLNAEDLRKRADPNPYLDLVRKLTTHYEAELAKLDAQQCERDHQNIVLGKQLREIEQYVNSVLYPDGPQPG